MVCFFPLSVGVLLSSPKQSLSLELAVLPLLLVSLHLCLSVSLSVCQRIEMFFVYQWTLMKLILKI